MPLPLPDPAGRAGRRPFVLGHRGDGSVPGNTVEAVARAAAAGADGVEIDVRLAGGRLVCRHDPGEGDRPPALFADVLRAAQDAGLRLIVDVKSMGDAGAEAAQLVSALEEAGRPELIHVSSFAVSLLEAVERTGAPFPLYPIVSFRRNFPAPRGLERWAGASVLAAVLVANPGLARSLRRRDQRLIVWFGWTGWRWAERAATRLDPWALIVDRIEAGREAVA